jgi:large subunit ribosomal protein L6
MSRVANNPVTLPAKVNAVVTDGVLTIKGSLGDISQAVHQEVEVVIDSDVLRFVAKSKEKNSIAQSGTMRALAANMVAGVSVGFSRKLLLVGVGYKAQVQGDIINLSLGFSHPVNYRLPIGITAETATPTELLIKGIDKQKVGQVAAEIRSIRPPEPYKGKGVRYSDEKILLKETKKK